MRSGGSVLEAPPGAEEGALPREHCPRAGHAALPRKHRPRAGCAEWCREHCPRAVSRTLPAQISFAACIGTEKGSPVFRRAFSVCARTSETKPDGVAGHAERGLRPQGAPAPQRGHSPASIVRVPVMRHSPASIVRKPSQQTAYRHKKGSPVFRRAFSVWATTPYGVAAQAR